MKEIRYAITDAVLAEIQRQTGGDFLRDGTLTTSIGEARRLDLDLIVEAMIDALGEQVPAAKELCDQIKAGAFSKG